MEIKEILKAIKFPFDEEKMEEIKPEDISDYMTKNYIGLEIAHESPEIVNKVVGKERSSSEVVVKRVLKDLGLKFDEDVTWKDGMLDKAGELIKSHIEGLKENASKTNDKKLNDLQSEYDKLKSDYNIVTGNVDKLKEELDGSQKEFTDFKINLDLNTKVKEARKVVEFGEDVTDLAKTGFWTLMDQKYKKELSTEQDSKDGLRVIESETGKRVNDGKENLTLQDIYKREAKEAGILKMNNNKPPEKKEVKTGGDDKPVRQPFGGAVKHAESMK